MSCNIHVIVVLSFRMCNTHVIEYSLAESLAAASGQRAGPVSMTVWHASVAADAVTVTVTLSDGNSEPLSLSARPLPADSGPGSNECDGSRAAGWASLSLSLGAAGSQPGLLDYNSRRATQKLNFQRSAKRLCMQSKIHDCFLVHYP